MIFGKKAAEEAEKLREEIGQLKSQNRTLIETLGFYANPNNWEIGNKYRDADDATIFTDGSNSAVSADVGKKASRTLNKIKKG